MSKSLRNNIFTKIQAFLLILVFSILLIPNTERSSIKAQTGSSSAMKKLAQPLQQVLNGQITISNSWFEANPADPFVLVLVQTYTSNTAPLRQAIKSSGGSVWARYYSINGVDAWIPVNKLLEIAGRSDVEVISPNYATQKSASSLEMVTGTTLQRSFNTATNQYSGVDGTGVGIAVLDSGVMTNNKGFEDQNGNSRIKAQADIIKLNSPIQKFKEFTPRDRAPFAGADFADLYYGTKYRTVSSLRC